MNKKLRTKYKKVYKDTQVPIFDTTDTIDNFGTRKCRPEGQKSAITEKEIAIFELRKVLFPEKHLRELPGACLVQLGNLKT